MLRVEGLAIAFGDLTVLRDLTFQVDRGDSLAIIGPNGAGKTVLFKALIGAIPFVGQIQWGPGVRIGYVPQKLDLERDLPITGLDLLSAKRRVVAGDELTVLSISHDLSVVYRSASNVLCLSRDRSCIGPPRKILTPALLEEIYGTEVEFHVHGA